MSDSLWPHGLQHVRCPCSLPAVILESKKNLLLLPFFPFYLPWSDVTVCHDLSFLLLLLLFFNVSFKSTFSLCLFQQSKRELCTWTSPDGQYRNQIDYILCSQRWRSSIESAKTRPGACGSDHQVLTVKFRLKLKKVVKTTKPFRYDLNKIPYDFTVEVINRFKGLDLVDGVPEEL